MPSVEKTDDKNKDDDDDLVLCFDCVQGQSYVGRTGLMVEGKRFAPVTTCCKRQCHQKVDAVEQQSLFNEFWTIGDYDQQNQFLAGSMSNSQSKRPYVLPA